MLYDEIKKANIQSMKDKDTVARSFYSVLLNKIKLREIDKKAAGQALEEADILNILQKTLKELEEEKANYQKAGYAQQVEDITRQMEIAGKFMPKMMSEEEIKNVILSLEDKSIPNVMKHFKANYNGKCDMKKVQEVLKGIK